MIKLLKNATQIITANTNGKNYKRGQELNNLDILEDHSIVIENGLIKDFVPNNGKTNIQSNEVIDLKDKVVLPGLVECHTHTAFAGSRADEFRLKLSGVNYEEIAKKGGGIISTVKAVRNSSFDELVGIIKPKIDYFISQGITTLEIKSGYGLSYYDEIKLLQVINHLNDIYLIDIVPTFLGAHTFPPEYNNDHDRYVDVLVNELLPYITKNKLAVFCDAFCEKTAFSADQVDRIFERSVKLELKLKLHTEQFNNIGGLDVALKHKVVSVDHLEVISDNAIDKVCKSDSVAVLLPGVSFFLDYDCCIKNEDDN
jgi:imidazolonepropionase